MIFFFFQLSLQICAWIHEAIWGLVLCTAAACCWLSVAQLMDWVIQWTKGRRSESQLCPHVEVPLSKTLTPRLLTASLAVSALHGSSRSLVLECMNGWMRGHCKELWANMKVLESTCIYYFRPCHCWYFYGNKWINNNHFFIAAFCRGWGPHSPAGPCRDLRSLVMCQVLMVRLNQKIGHESSCNNWI